MGVENPIWESHSYGNPMGMGIAIRTAHDGNGNGNGNKANGNGNSIYFTRVKIPPAGEAPYFTGIWQCQQRSVSAQQYALTELNLTLNGLYSELKSVKIK